MSACFDMSWDGRHRRWWKQHNGKKYVRSCKQLNAPETKMGSYQQANEWWRKKRAEIDGRVPPHPYADYLDLLEKRLVLARQDGWHVRELTDEIDRIRKGGIPMFLETEAPIGLPDEIPLGKENNLAQEYEEELISRTFDPFDTSWNDRVARSRVEATPEDLRVGTQVDAWLGLRRLQAETGGLSAKGFDNLRHRLKHFTKFVGRDSPIDSIDEKKWRAFWWSVMETDWSRDHKKGVMTTARMFVEWASRQGVVVKPANLLDREFKIRIPAQEVPVMTVDEVRRLVDSATGQLKLHVLLMANCGMGQTDISDLLQTDVDWTEGRIIRKRSKTDEYERVPTVNYPLWPLTLKLLREYRAEGELVLLNKLGHPWVSRELVNGKFSNYDGIGQNLKRLRKKLGMEKRPKDIRKTSASLLGLHESYERFVEEFLGEAPRTIAKRHYQRPDEAGFDRAVAWLGQQYGYAE